MSKHSVTAHQKQLIARVIKGSVLDEFVFDVHSHTADGWALCNIYDGTVAGLQQEMEALGFTGMVASAICAISGVDFTWANNALQKDLGKAPGQLWGYVGIDIRQGPRLVDMVEAYLNNGFHGGKLYTRFGVPYDDVCYHPVFELINARNLPVLAHCWGGENITALAAAAQKFPHINFIAAHTGSADLDVYMEKARTVPNLYIDTALSSGKRGLIETVVRTIGSEKLVFGSDAALFSAAQQVARVVAARISDDDRRNILGLNAKRLFIDIA